MSTDRFLRRALLGLLIFLGLTAVAGGLALIGGAISPPIDMLAGSPFKDYTVPGLALLIPVGGGALVAAGLLWRGHPWARAASGMAGLMIIAFEIVEVWAIGSEPGVARNLQRFYLAIGLLIALGATALWARRTGQPSPLEEPR